MKKKLLLVLFIFGIFGFMYFQRSGKIDAFVKENLYTSYCSTPIYYKEGSIDPRFGLSRQEVIKASNLAANIWNEEVGFDVFSYDPDATLTINMVYDQRQSLDTQIRNLQGGLDSGKITLDSEREYYESQVALFEEKSADFQRKVNDWNTKRGGSQEEYDALVREQDVLEQEADRLNQIAEQLNLSAYEYNTQVDEINNTIDTFNSVLEEKPEEGLYDSFNSEIYIYFNNDPDKLIRTIAHELGHARGLGHTNDEKDLMYPVTTNVLTLSETDINMLEKICEPFPIYEPYLNNSKHNFNYLMTQLFN